MAGDLTHQRPRAGVSLNEYPRAQPCSRSIRGYTQAHCALAAQPIPLLPSFLLSSMKMRAVTFAAAIAGVALLSCSYVHAEEEKWGEGRLWVPGGAFPEEIDDADFDSFAKVYSTMEYSHGEENFKKYCPRSIHQVRSAAAADIALCERHLVTASLRAACSPSPPDATPPCAPVGHLHVRQLRHLHS